MRGGGMMGSPSPPQAPIFWIFFRAIVHLFMGIRRTCGLRPCYHALRQPVGAADRALLHN